LILCKLLRLDRTVRLTCKGTLQTRAFVKPNINNPFAARTKWMEFVDYPKRRAFQGATKESQSIKPPILKTLRPVLTPRCPTEKKNCKILS
jgi:hypothetical protein